MAQACMLHVGDNGAASRIEQSFRDEQSQGDDNAARLAGAIGRSPVLRSLFGGMNAAAVPREARKVEG